MIKKLFFASPASAGVVGLVIALGVGVGRTPAQEVATASETSSVETRDGSTHGIRVHGHWVIEVRDPDGSLAQRREFDNALMTTGVEVLGSVMAKEATIGHWRIWLGRFVCENGASSPANCLLFEATDAVSPGNPHVFNTLTVAATTGGLVLSGQATAQRDGSITEVMTRAKMTGQPAASGPFTLHNDVPGTPVFAGQSISVTVTITFS